MTLILSRLVLNPEHAQARRDLATPYDLHRTLARAFPDDGPDAHRARHGILFRVEDATPAGVAVLVQSTTAPDWARLAPGYALRADGPKPFSPSLADGQRLRFRLVANPVKRVREDGRPHPVRVALETPRLGADAGTGYLDWLDRQASKAGTAIEAVADVPFRLAGKRRRRPNLRLAKADVPHFGVRFDGTLRVTDARALAQAIRDGIGPAKAFGFGLLSLGPV